MIFKLLKKRDYSLRNEAYDNARIYKDKTKKWHDQKIMRKEFKWSGPYTVVASAPFGTVTLKTDSRKFKVNGKRLKHYLGGNINED